MPHVLARLALVAALAVTSCRQQIPDQELLPDDLEALAAGRSDCALPAPSPASVIQRWQVESLRGTVSLPPRYRFAPNAEAGMRWVDPDSTVLELHGTTALGGLATAGDVGEWVPESPCALPFLGRRAATPRFLLLRSGATDTIFVGAPGMAGPRGGGVQALIFAQSAAARDELLTALTTLELDPQ